MDKCRTRTQIRMEMYDIIEEIDIMNHDIKELEAELNRLKDELSALPIPTPFHWVDKWTAVHAESGQKIIKMAFGLYTPDDPHGIHSTNMAMYTANWNGHLHKTTGSKDGPSTNQFTVREARDLVKALNDAIEVAEQQ